MISTTEQLEEMLSRPAPADCEALACLEGDLLILGAGGKMGPSLAVRAARAMEQSHSRKRVIAVSRFTEPGVREKLERAGVGTIAADLLDSTALARLPDAPNIVFMAGRKFGTSGEEHLTWAMNVLMPALVADRFRDSRMVAFSSGNVYPVRDIALGGAGEQTAPDPAGEYAQSVLGRERIFQHYAHRFGTRVVLLRLNYAVEMRYGVLADIARKVFEGHAIDLAMGYVNVIWQGDANSIALRAFPLCESPPAVLNVTGPEILAVREVACRFGRLFGREPRFEASEGATALLSDARRCHRLFGPPAVSADQLIEWTAYWVGAGGNSLGKPTHFEVRDGRF